jgi:hypothetical protein
MTTGLYHLNIFIRTLEMIKKDTNAVDDMTPADTYRVLVS